MKIGTLLNRKPERRNEGHIEENYQLNSREFQVKYVLLFWEKRDLQFIIFYYIFHLNKCTAQTLFCGTETCIVLVGCKCNCITHFNI
jgi:hypothetical protein